MVSRILSILLILIMVMTSFTLFSCTPNDSEEPGTSEGGETPDGDETPDETPDEKPNDEQKPSDDIGGNFGGGDIDLPRDEFD